MHSLVENPEIPDQTLDEAICWQAVLDRTAAPNPPFVYAVRSTGIYCRPACPSRRPQRQQARFFATPDAAEEAGFRACRRCHPRAESAGPSTEQVALVEQICSYIAAHSAEPTTLETLGAAFHMSPTHLQRTFKRVLGLTPREYADVCRLESFKDQLRSGASVTEALYAAGYGSSSRLYERAPTQIGMTPTTYQRGGAGMAISYTIVDSPLNRMLVAATERGLCAVYLGDNDEQLAAELEREYHRATISVEEFAPRGWVDELLQHLASRQPSPTLPLDLQASAFQWQVWQTLQAIPIGETRTYQEIAHEIGKPTAARAVGRACATNPVSVVIPCHRAIRVDGGLGGYRWGLDRKRQLLDWEAAR